VTSAADAGAATPWPKAATAWYAVGVLLIAYTFAYIDRAILTILVEPIQRDLHINDTQVALLHGFAFVIFYVGLGVPLGFLADRSRRTTLAVGSILIWSLMTAAGGLTRTFGQLFTARIGVGIGEAGLSPAAYSLIADYFPPARRSTAMGVYTLGLFAGGGLALLLGGVIVALVGARPDVIVPVLGKIRAWQLVFFAVGLPGLLVGVLAMTIKEPPRRRLTGEVTTTAPGAGLKALWGQLGRQGGVYARLMLAFAFLGVPFNVALLWARPYLSRRFGVTPAEGAFAVGGAMLVFATAGILCGSALCDRMTARGVSTAPIRLSLGCALLVIVPIVLLPIAPTLPLAITALSALLFFGAGSFGAAPAALQLITPNEMRATVSALYLLAANLVGLTMGPVVTGALTDYVFHDKSAVGISAAIVGAGSAVVAAILFAGLPGAFRRAGEVHAATSHPA
jgi:MFS family permease